MSTVLLRVLAVTFGSHVLATRSTIGVEPLAAASVVINAGACRSAV